MENHLSLRDKVEITDREEHKKRRCLKEAAYMLGHVDLLSRPSIEMNTIWGTNNWKGQIKLILKKIILKISIITDAIIIWITFIFPECHVWSTVKL